MRGTLPKNYMTAPARPRIAIVGTGIAGLGCAYLLREHADLVLFEKGDHIGGHTHTVEVKEPGTGRMCPVDTGFMVFNKVTYPRLTRLFDELGVAIKPTDMSFSVSHAASGFEYRGSDLNTLFARRRNLLRPRYWRFLLAINRFNADAARDWNKPELESLTLDDYVRRGAYGDDFFNLYLVPMASAVWSTPPETMLRFPAATLLRFFHNHGFLGLDTQHPWFTVAGGSRSYVAKILAALRIAPADIRPGVVRISRPEPGGALVHTADGAAHAFDRVVLATHADEALALLESPTAFESRVLGEFRYRDNAVTLHTDASVLPKIRRARASWNYAVRPGPDGRDTYCTHYWMNSLQGISDRENYFVTVNHPERIAPEKILRRFDYAHPLFTLGAIAAQKELPALNRVFPNQAVHFAGSYFRYGFHEDALLGGEDAAGAILGRAPW